MRFQANDDAVVYYKDIVKTGNELLKRGIAKCAELGKVDVDNFTVLNGLSWERSEVVQLPDKTLSK